MALTREQILDRLNAEPRPSKSEVESLVAQLEALGVDPRVADEMGKSDRAAKSYTETLLNLGEAISGVSNANTTAGTSFARLAFNYNEQDAVSKKLIDRMGSVLDRSIALTNETERLQATFNASTGQMGKFNDELFAGFTRNVQFGGSLQDSHRALSTLLEAVPHFTSKTLEQRQAMVDHSIVLEKLGVYQRDYASGFDTMTMAMGLSDEEANEVFPNMIALAHSLGMSSSDLTSKFSAQSGQFAVFGDQGVHHFRRLVIASREVSVEMGTMLQTTKRFDEFTSGAEAVQKNECCFGRNISRYSYNDKNDRPS